MIGDYGFDHLKKIQIRSYQLWFYNMKAYVMEMY